MLVRRVTQQEEPTAATIYDTDWAVEFIDGIEALPERRATFRIEQSGRIGGKGPCNGYFASAKIEGTALAIGHAGATQMACAPELMAAEQALFTAFGKAVAYRLDAG